MTLENFLKNGNGNLREINLSHNTLNQLNLAKLFVSLKPNKTLQTLLLNVSSPFN